MQTVLTDLRQRVVGLSLREISTVLCMRGEKKVREVWKPQLWSNLADV